MGNHYYIISEEKFHRDKDTDNAVREFVKGTGIDLDSECRSRIPTISQIRQCIRDYGLDIAEEYRESSRLEISIVKDNLNLYFIFTDFEDENDEAFMFELARGSDHELAIEFIKHMGMKYGGFLLYCDSGEMSFITTDKDNGKGI